MLRPEAGAILGLAYKRMIQAEWNAKQCVLHSFEYPLYATHIGRPDWQVLPE
jgi:hypothetical protein